MIVQGVACHVNLHAEELRSRFVAHQDTISLEVRRDDFIKGSPENEWPKVFTEFSTKIRNHIGTQTHDMFVPSFSTTGERDRAAVEVSLLDAAMQSYFSYDFFTLCGIPEIILDGLPEDWELLLKQTRNLAQFDLTWWIDVLSPILEEFLAASQGRINLKFWQSIYKLADESGGPYLTGWLCFFSLI